DCTPAAVVTDDASRSLGAHRDRCSVIGVEELTSGDSSAEGTAVPGTTSNDLACLIYTSGSTARPKGVMSCHSHVAFATAAIASRLGLNADAIAGRVLALTFDYGRSQVFLALHIGATVVLGEGVDAR